MAEAKYIEVTRDIAKLLRQADITPIVRNVNELNIKYRRFSMKPPQADLVADALLDELQRWGGFVDILRGMTEESRHEFREEISALIRTRVNKISHSAK